MEFKDLMQNRFACKKYDEKRVSDSIIEYILDCGRLTPSSFGFEAWEFHVILNKEKRKELYEACFRQESMETSAFSIVLCTPRSSMKKDDSLVIQRAIRFPGSLSEFLDDYSPYQEYLQKENRIESWLKAQTYLVCANMMNAAVEKEVQSCAIEGFDEKKVLNVLNLDANEKMVGIVITFGYKGESVREKIRMDLNEITTYYR